MKKIKHQVEGIRKNISEILKHVTLEDFPKFPLPKEVSIYRWKGGVSIRLPKKVKPYYDNIVKIFEKCEISKELSLKDCKDALDNAIFSKVLENLNKCKEITQLSPKEIVEEFINELQSKTDRRVILFPITGIDLRIGELKIGKCRFFKPSQEWCDSREIKLKDSVFKLRVGKEVSFSIPKLGSKPREHIFTVPPLCVEVSLKASTNYAFEKGLEIIEEVKGLLYLFLPFNKYAFRYEESSFGVSNICSRYNLMLPIWKAKELETGVLFSFIVSQRRIPTRNLLLSDKILRNYKAAGFDDFSKLLGEEETELTDIGKRIKSALLWYGRSIDEINKCKQFLHASIALESLLTPESQEERIASTIAEYSAFLLGRDSQSRLNLETLLKQLYKVRSGIVHGRITYVGEYKVSQIRSVVWALLFKFMDLIKKKKLRSYNDLLEYIKEVKYTGDLK